MRNELVVYEIVDNKKDATDIRYISTREYKVNFERNGFPKSIIHTARRKHLVLPKELEQMTKSSPWSEIRVKDENTAVISFNGADGEIKEIEYPLDKVLIKKREKVLYVKELVSLESLTAVHDWHYCNHEKVWDGNYIFGEDNLRKSAKLYAKNREILVYMNSLADKFENNKAFITLKL